MLKLIARGGMSHNVNIYQYLIFFRPFSLREFCFIYCIGLHSLSIIKKAGLMDPNGSQWIPMDPNGSQRNGTWPFSQLPMYSIDYIPTDIYIYIDGWFYTPHVGQTKYMAIVEVWHRKAPSLFGCAARFRQRKKIPCCLRCLMSYSAAQPYGLMMIDGWYQPSKWQSIGEVDQIWSDGGSYCHRSQERTSPFCQVDSQAETPEGWHLQRGFRCAGEQNGKLLWLTHWVTGDLGDGMGSN